MLKVTLLLSAIVLTASTALRSEPLTPAIADPPPDAAVPAGQDAFVLPVQHGAMNCLMYTASGAGLHPTLLLLHGFPGNEQNLDLAQAARRAGWNVMTMHYRGSWGSPGAFSFRGATEDAHAALAFLRSPAPVAKYRIDARRIAVAGHSMGGFMAADAAADDPRVIGLFLIDPWDIGHFAETLISEAGRKAWHQEAVGDLAPLAGTSEQALAGEMRSSARRFSLTDRVHAYGDRPLAIYGAARGNGDDNNPIIEAAQRTTKHVLAAVWKTDHSFSDKRVALSKALVAWLQTFPER